MNEALACECLPLLTTTPRLKSDIFSTLRFLLPIFTIFNIVSALWVLVCTGHSIASPTFIRLRLNGAGHEVHLSSWNLGCWGPSVVESRRQKEIFRPFKTYHRHTTSRFNTEIISMCN